MLRDSLATTLKDCPYLFPETIYGMYPLYPGITEFLGSGDWNNNLFLLKSYQNLLIIIVKLL